MCGDSSVLFGVVPLDLRVEKKTDSSPEVGLFSQNEGFETCRKVFDINIGRRQRKGIIDHSDFSVDIHTPFPVSA